MNLTKTLDLTRAVLTCVVLVLTGIVLFGLIVFGLRLENAYDTFSGIGRETPAASCDWVGDQVVCD